MAAVIPPEQARGYPEPSQFGTFPAQGLFIRHARNIEIRDVGIESQAADVRSFVWLGDVDGAYVKGLRLPSSASAPAFLLDDVRYLHVSTSSKVPDGTFATVAHGSLP
jgi:hypothetical protein